MTDPIAKLFGSHARVKLLRLFLFNPASQFTPAEAATHARVKDADTRLELRELLDIGVIENTTPRRGLSNSARLALNEKSPYLSPLRQLLLNAPERGEELYSELRQAGIIKLIILSGIFSGEWDSRLDLLIVGDRIDERKLRTALSRFESEIGKELRYAVLSSEDFGYRSAMNDHLLRDVLDYPHRVVLDRMNSGLG